MRSISGQALDADNLAVPGRALVRGIGWHFVHMAAAGPPGSSWAAHLLVCYLLTLFKP